MSLSAHSSSMPPDAAHGQDSRGLVGLVAAMPPERFAVLDGALFSDIQLELSINGLAARPIFLEAGDAAAVASGPFLMALPTVEDIERVLRFNGSRRSPVFWSWPAGETALYRHLRTLNLAEIPDENRESEDAPAYETVIFRHWDAIVLGQILPLFRPGQMARFLGAGHVLGATDTGEIAPPNSAGAVAVETAMLRFTPDQIDSLGGVRAEQSQRRIMQYLIEVEPGSANRMDRNALRGLVERSALQARSFGADTEASIGRYAYLNLITSERFAAQPGVADYLRAGPDPNLQIKRFIDSLAAAALRIGRP